MEDRSKIPAEFKWDLTAIYNTEEDFTREYDATLELISALPAHKDTMLNGARELYAALYDMAQVEQRIDMLWTYASLNFSVNAADNSAQARENKVRDLAVRAGEASWFISPYLIRLDEQTLEGYFAECPELETFRRTVYKIMRYKPHTLSDECEQLYSKMEDCLGLHSSVRSIFAESDLRFGKITDAEGKRVELTGTNYITYMLSPVRRVRRSAFKTLYKTYKDFGNTFATVFSNHVKENTTLARVRNYADSITASTFRDEVTPEIYNNLIATVNRGLPRLFEYYELKRRALGLSKLHIYDIYTPLIASEERNYTYDEARREVLDAVSVFGEEYTEVMRAGLYERGWVDVYPSRGKRGGAFSSGCPGTEPYILLNFNGTADDVSTLAHEGGHSMHSYYSRKYNEPHDSQYTIFVAEVASTVNELILMRKKLRESTSDTEKLNILNQLMELYKGTLYRQTMFAEFERDVHAMTEAGQPLTQEVINDLYYSINKRYFGTGVELDREIAYEWMRIPHFYTCFYVYKYATCISAATAIVTRIEREGAEYVKKYIDFLKCGGSRSPIDSLLVAEIDMTRPEVVETAIDAFGEAVREFKEIYERSEKK